MHHSHCVSDSQKRLWFEEIKYAGAVYHLQLRDCYYLRHFEAVLNEDLVAMKSWFAKGVEPPLK